MNYVYGVSTDSISNLTDSYSFYAEFSFKLLQSDLNSLIEVFKVPIDLEAIYYPWNRTFEIGFLTPVTFPTAPWNE